MRLEKRISLTTSILILGLLVCTCLILTRTIRSSEKARLIRNQKAVKTLYLELQNQRFEGLESKTKLLGSLPQLKAALSTNDSATITDVLGELKTSTQADFLHATNKKGAVFGWDTESKGDPFSTLVKEVQKSKKPVRGFLNNKARILQVVATPVIYGGRVKHVLIAGFRIEKKFLQSLKAMTQTQFALRTEKNGLLIHITKDSNSFLRDLSELKKDASQNPAFYSDYIFSSFDLKTPNHEKIATIYAFQPLAEGLRVSNKLQKQIIIFAILFCIFGVFVSVLIGRSIAKPIRHLTETLKSLDLADMNSTKQLSSKTQSVAADKDIQTVFETLNRILRTMDYERDKFFEEMSNSSQNLKQKVTNLENENKKLVESNEQLQNLLGEKDEAA